MREFQHVLKKQTNQESLITWVVNADSTMRSKGQTKDVIVIALLLQVMHKQDLSLRVFLLTGQSEDKQDKTWGKSPLYTEQCYRKGK